MCRQNVLCGGCVLAFGFGVLIGTWLENGFVCHLIGAALIFLGFTIIRKH